jgi:hypothetical protein
MNGKYMSYIHEFFLFMQVLKYSGNQMWPVFKDMMVNLCKKQCIEEEFEDTKWVIRIRIKRYYKTVNIVQELDG